MQTKSKVGVVETTLEDYAKPKDLEAKQVHPYGTLGHDPTGPTHSNATVRTNEKVAAKVAMTGRMVNKRALVNSLADQYFRKTIEYLFKNLDEYA